MSAQIINLSDRRKKLSKASPNLMGVSLSIFAAHADVSLAMCAFQGIVSTDFRRS
jgi:hypothetical protein